MTRQHHFETADFERTNRVQAKKLAIEERKCLARIGALQRMRQRTEGLLTNMKHAATLLNHAIEAELRGSPTRDPDHHAFPMTARTLMARRDNLEATIEVLCNELALGDQLKRLVA